MARLVGIVLGIMLLLPIGAQAQLQTGLDRLTQEPGLLPPGSVIALVTNHTGRTSQGKSAYEVIRSLPGVTIAAIFAPEHGFAGKEDRHISDSSHAGLPIYSLYGKRCIPTAAMLAGVNTIVFDIQDAGVRYYTYLGTLHTMLNTSRQYHLRLVLLDRPNPIGGNTMDGAIPAPNRIAEQLRRDSTGCKTLTITHSIPTRHGMTLGELAQMVNTEAAIHADLHVIPMIGWKREQQWQELTIPWVPPSPNLKDPIGALLYSAFGPLEATNLSVGRGTELPFHYYGAPWLDAEAVHKKLPQLPGVQFSTISFVPTAIGHPYAGQRCNGIRISCSEQTPAQTLSVAALSLAQAIYQTHANRYRADAGFHGMIGDATIWKRITVGGVTPAAIVSEWQEGLRVFAERRRPFLLYTD